MFQAQRTRTLWGCTVRKCAQAPQRIDIKKLSTTVEDVVVPLPNEIFGALNKLGAVNWKQHLRSDKGPNFTERPRIALLLGTVIADGFIAVASGRRRNRKRHRAARPDVG
jgi:hypothetical protein